MDVAWRYLSLQSAMHVRPAILPAFAIVHSWESLQSCLQSLMRKCIIFST